MKWNDETRFYSVCLLNAVITPVAMYLLDGPAWTGLLIPAAVAAYVLVSNVRRGARIGGDSYRRVGGIVVHGSAGIAFGYVEAALCAIAGYGAVVVVAIVSSWF